MKVLIFLLLFYSFSFGQDEQIIMNNGLSNTAIVDDIMRSQNELQETKEQIDFRNSIESQMSGRLTNSISKAKISQFELEQRRQMTSPSIGGLRVDNRIKANTYDTPFNEVYTQLNDGTYKLKSKPSLETHNTVYTQQSDGTYKLKSSIDSTTILTIIFVLVGAIVLFFIFRKPNNNSLKTALRKRIDNEFANIVSKLPPNSKLDEMQLTIDKFQIGLAKRAKDFSLEYNIPIEEVFSVIDQYFIDFDNETKKHISQQLNTTSL